MQIPPAPLKPFHGLHGLILNWYTERSVGIIIRNVLEFEAQYMEVPAGDPKTNLCRAPSRDITYRSCCSPFCPYTSKFSDGRTNYIRDQSGIVWLVNLSLRVNWFLFPLRINSPHSRPGRGLERGINQLYCASCRDDWPKICEHLIQLFHHKKFV